MYEQSYQDDLDAIEAYIAEESPKAGTEMWLRIDEQVGRLADPKFPRCPGRVDGTAELVAHENYIVIIEDGPTAVTVLNVIHARRKYP